MEFVVCHSNREVSLVLAARRESREQLCVKQRHPAGPRRLPPVQKRKQCARRVVDARVLSFCLVYDGDELDLALLTPLSEKKTLLRVTPSGNATVSSFWQISSRFTFSMVYNKRALPSGQTGPLPIVRT